MLGNALILVFALALAADPPAPAPASGQSNERICRGGGQRDARQSHPDPPPLPDGRPMAAGG